MRVRQIQRADRTDTGLVEHVGIDHDGRYVRVSKQFLHGANIRVCFRQVRCETVTQGMASQPLVDTACVCRALDGLLQRTLMQVMSAKCAAARISGEATCRKQELPLQFTARIRILARLQITNFLGRQLACHCRMGNLEFPGGVEPVTPVDIACGR
jgi:hypothetical protein